MNWISLSADDLKAVALGDAIDAARTLAAGAADPVDEAIANAVAAVRGAISTGNALDQDTATVPRSLRALTARTAAFALLERVGIELNADQRATRQADTARLAQITAQRQRFERADDPAGSAEMQTGGDIDTITEGNAGHGRTELRGL